MNSIHKIFYNDADQSITTRHSNRTSLLGISNELAFQKVVLGFFENGISDYRFAQSDPTACAKLEFFAGSLSCKIFREQLISFLSDTQEIKQFHPKTLESIQEFIEASANGDEQACAIDMIRSQSLKYIWLALTGNRSFITSKDSFDVSDQEIDEIIQLTINKINSLNPGVETATFLTGSPIHETLMAVQLTKSNEWQLFHCDSASKETINVYSPKPDEILNRDFWKSTFCSKFGKKPFSKITFTSQKNSRINAAKIAHQNHNTCHVQSQMALLKNFIVNLSDLSILESQIEWKLFKMQFGSFLIKQKMIEKESPLAAICQIGHTKHQQQLDKAAFFQRCIQEGNHEETIKVYEDLHLKYGTCFVNYTPSPENPLKTLLALDRLLNIRFNSLLLTGDQLIPILQQIDNPYVQYSFNRFLEDYLKNHVDGEKELLEEIERSKNQLHSAEEASYSNLFSQMMTSVDTFVNQIVKKEEIRTFHKSAKPVAFSLKQLRSYLTQFIENPQWLSNLQSKPSYTSLLLQGVQSGCFREIDLILGKLNYKDKVWFLQNSLEFQEISDHFFTDEMEDYLLNCQNSTICATDKVGEGFVKRMIRNLELSTLFKIHNFGCCIQDVLSYKLKQMKETEIAQLKIEISKLDQTHPVTKDLVASMTDFYYKTGRFQDLLAYTNHSKIRCVCIFHHNAETFKNALAILEQAPKHPMSKRIAIDLIFYAIQEKDSDLLTKMLPFAEVNNIGVHFTTLYYPRKLNLSQFNLSQLTFFYDAIKNVPGLEEQAETCLKAISEASNSGTISI